ncbi:MAG: hypothetical protein OXF66_09990 [Gammaproteobacteria bacterium]|nr:hypothetical protein [Gammaproteobacteria bacterium]
MTARRAACPPRFYAPIAEIVRQRVRQQPGQLLECGAAQSRKFTQRLPGWIGTDGDFRKPSFRQLSLWLSLFFQENRIKIQIYQDDEPVIGYHLSYHNLTKKSLGSEVREKIEYIY